MRTPSKSRPLAGAVAMLSLLLGGTVLSRPAQAAPPVTIALPGVPPIIADLVFFVARDQGFFKKEGVDVSLRPFDNGTAAEQAVAAGDFDLSLSPTPGTIRVDSNSNVRLVGIWGTMVPDWQLATIEPNVTSCKQIKGQPVGVDAIGGARAVALGAFLRACGLKPSDVTEVPLGSNVAPAMAAGQVTWGALHIDDVETLQAQSGKKVNVVESFNKIEPLSHYLLLVSTPQRIAQKKDQFARVVAALEDASAWMQKPENLQKAAEIAHKSTGQPQAVMEKALPRFFAIKYWPVDSAGLDQANVEAAIKIQEQAGAIKPGNKPVGYDQLVDTSVWDQAKKLMQPNG